MDCASWHWYRRHRPVDSPRKRFLNRRREQMLDLTKMKELANGAQSVKPVSRTPVKTQFTEDERETARYFYLSQHSRSPHSMRMRSFFNLCKLLGERLDASNWHLLEAADIVGDLHFLVGKGTVKSGNDWQLKCLGLAEVRPEVFVVGVNQVFYDHAVAYWVDRLPPNDPTALEESRENFAGPAVSIRAPQLDKGGWRSSGSTLETEKTHTVKCLLPSECYDLHPGIRLQKTRAHVSSLSDGDQRRLHRRLKQELSFPHCAYAVPAWGLMVLPGPGGEEGDPTEEHCDWTPGLGKTSRHFAEFPSYVVHHYPLSERNKRGMWQGMRARISDVSLPGVRSTDRFACWGLINLTTEHARSEAVRRTKFWNMETHCWQVIETCRPALIIAPPSKMGGGRCYDRLQKFLREKGATPVGTMQYYRADKGSRTWDFQWWKTPWDNAASVRCTRSPRIGEGGSQIS